MTALHYNHFILNSGGNGFDSGHIRLILYGCPDTPFLLSKQISGTH
jgi:hypothetical protein